MANSTPKTTWLITGTSRGIGLELTRQLLADPSTVVFATCRNPGGASALHALKDHPTTAGTLHVLALDAADEASIRSAVKEVERILRESGLAGLDYVDNNAAMNVGNDTAFDFDPADLHTTMQLNVVGPALLTRLCLPLLEKGRRKVVVNMTTGLASIGIDAGPKCASYSISKVALNMLTYKQKKERPDLTVVCIDPGWVKTAMGGEGAMLETEFSVKNLLKVITGLTNKDSGKFLRYTGDEIPW